MRLWSPHGRSSGRQAAGCIHPFVCPRHDLLPGGMGRVRVTGRAGVPDRARAAGPGGAGRLVSQPVGRAGNVRPPKLTHAALGSTTRPSQVAGLPSRARGLTEVRVWWLADGRPVGESLTGHDGWVNAVAVGALPDSTPVIVSAGEDGTVRVWRLADGTAVAPPLDLSEPVKNIAMRGNIIVTAVGQDIAVHQLASAPCVSGPGRPT